MAAKGVEGESRSGEGDLKLRRADGVATIVFDRPTRANALTEEVLAQLADTLETLSRDTETRVLVIRGSGERVFAAGSDLQEISDRTPPVYALDLAAKSGLTQIMRAELPTLAAINGDCIGGGVIIAIAADFRIAVSTARFGIPVGTLGFAYPVEAVERLVHLVGQAMRRGCSSPAHASTRTKPCASVSSSRWWSPMRSSAWWAKPQVRSWA